MKPRILPISERHIRSYHAAFDRVARERKYFTLLKAPPLKVMRKFVQGILRAKDLQFVALEGNEVIGWCDVVRARHDLGFKSEGARRNATRVDGKYYSMRAMALLKDA